MEGSRTSEDASGHERTTLPRTGTYGDDEYGGGLW